MKFHLLPRADIRDTDTPSMQNDIAFLLEQGVDVRRPAKSTCQLKLDQTTNYYPGKGTLFVDGDPEAWPEKGRAALQKWLAVHVR